MEASKRASLDTYEHLHTLSLRFHIHRYIILRSSSFFLATSSAPSKSTFFLTDQSPKLLEIWWPSNSEFPYLEKLERFCVRLNVVKVASVRSCNGRCSIFCRQFSSCCWLWSYCWVIIALGLLSSLLSLSRKPDPTKIICIPFQNNRISQWIVAHTIDVTTIVLTIIITFQRLRSIHYFHHRVENQVPQGYEWRCKFGSMYMKRCLEWY